MVEKPALALCLKHGIKVYPVRQQKDVYRKNQIHLERGHWYIEVDNNGRKTRYPKSLGSGQSISGKKLTEAIHKTLLHWQQKIKNQDD